ncbi:MAG: TGS domain-containing protein [Candidatus Aenigmatarchaeota archaeon]
MPANLPAEWYAIEKKYLEAKTLEEKIFWLEKLIGKTPKHKGTENLLADLRKRLSKLKSLLEKKSKKVGGTYTYFKKVGSVIVSILGIANSGKSYWLNKLCNTNLESSEIEYETKEPKSGIFVFEGIEFQLVEIPSFFLSKHMWIPRISDANIFLISDALDLDSQLKIYEEVKNKYELNNVFLVVNDVLKKELKINALKMSEYEKVFSEIWKSLNKIRVFTKPPGKEVSEKALILDKNSTVFDAIREIDERMIEKFKSCIVYRNGKEIRVGQNFILEDKDIIEIRTKA